MMPGPYNVPVQMMHQGRRPNQPEYYHPSYYQQPQYHPAHNPYAQQWYPAPYQNQPAYRPYPQYPPQPHHNGPMIVSSHPQHPSVVPPQHRQSYPSPVPIPISTPTMAPPASTPQSAQSQETPAPSTPSPAPENGQTASTAQATTPNPLLTPVTSPIVSHRLPFYPKLPWYSVPESEYPPRTHRRRRRARQESPAALELPERLLPATSDTPNGPPSEGEVTTNAQTPELDSIYTRGIASSSDLSTESPHRQKSDISTAESSTTQTTPKSHVKPVLPVVPVAPRVHEQISAVPQTPPTEHQVKVNSTSDSGEKDKPEAEQPKPTSPPPKAPPKSWAELLRSKAPPASQLLQNGSSTNTDTLPLAKSKTASLAEVLKAFNVSSSSKTSFLEPRGLVNTGNMCYMNSILQVLVFCIPFYDFLEQVGKNAAHSFKSDTPLLDAMILFMREFNVIDAADSVEKLRMRLKDSELEQYGESLVPEYVYDVIKNLPRFSTMRRGHQQDAEEFMGFLLQGLNDECASVLRHLPPSSEADVSKSPPEERAQTADAGWLEVGPKQKSAVTRASGFDHSDSPITKIFVGKFRSELRVPGLKTSVTMEPYQTIPLDIGAPTVQNIVDALKGLTRPETLHGDFGSPRGPGTTATKQTFIDTLPPVLILHLKRFHFENTGGVQKIWKKVGYPLELTLPKEVFSPSRRNAVALSGMPKYRLSAVVYHHGKNAGVGHYTVDIRRQDGLEWIRLDDTLIRRLRAEDVASGGAEEDPKVLAKALEVHQRQQSAAGGQNFFDSIGSGSSDNDEDDERPWSQVSSANAKDNASGRKWATVANGSNGETTPSGKRTPKWESAKDNKVAYILFYRKIE